MKEMKRKRFILIILNSRTRIFKKSVKNLVVDAKRFEEVKIYMIFSGSATDCVKLAKRFNNSLPLGP